MDRSLRDVQRIPEVICETADTGLHLFFQVLSFQAIRRAGRFAATYGCRCNSSRCFSYLEYGTGPAVKKNIPGHGAEPGTTPGTFCGAIRPKHNSWR
jgi:hypothetical protein